VRTSYYIILKKNVINNKHVILSWQKYIKSFYSICIISKFCSKCFAPFLKTIYIYIDVNSIIL